MKPQDVAVPFLMSKLPKDKRGYPIPVTVLMDEEGNPHFTVSNDKVRQDVIQHDKCALCGNKLYRFKWFVGGPKSAFAKDGAYFDPPMHKECAVYALQVCPWLAAPAYSRRIEGATLQPQNLPRGLSVAVDPSQAPERPPLFVAVASTVILANKDVTGAFMHVKPKPPLTGVEFWRNGKRLTEKHPDVVSVVIKREGVWHLTQPLVL